MDHKFGANFDRRSETAGRASRRQRRAVAAMAPALVLVGLVIAGVTAIAARAAIVSTAPATAAVYAAVGLPVNLRGLAIDDVRATVAQQTKGQGELLVTGEIANLRDRETPVP